MGGDQRLLHFGRRDVGAAANDDVFLAGHEPELISLPAPHQIAGMIPAGLQAFRCRFRFVPVAIEKPEGDRKSTRLNSSHQIISYAVFCLKKKKKNSSEKEESLHRAFVVHPT